MLIQARGLLAGLVAVLCVSSIIASAAYAQRTLEVPAKFKTIQAAIDAASKGDTVLVARGTYVENIDFKGKAILVRGREGYQSTTIDGGGKGSVVTFKNGEGPASVICRFTITNGAGTAFGASARRGGGIYCSSSSPTIDGNRITKNVIGSSGWGAGVFADSGSAPVISNNEISDNAIMGNSNSAPGYGAGICCSAGTIISNAILRNRNFGYPYTINRRLEMLLLRQFGADGFFTNRPALGLVVAGQAESIDIDALLRSHGF